MTLFKAWSHFYRLSGVRSNSVGSWAWDPLCFCMWGTHVQIGRRWQPHHKTHGFLVLASLGEACEVTVGAGAGYLRKAWVLLEQSLMKLEN